MSWIYVFLAAVLEVAGATCLKLSKGLTDMLPSIFVFLFYILSFTIISLALKKLNLSMVYGIWAGLGTVGITTISFLWLDEPASLAKLGGISLIVIGVIALKLSSKNELVEQDENELVEQDEKDSASVTLVEKG
ncbi:multidrug efflux SMR transporter [Iningainema sp. BLCCT55]|uniref:Multidrug efflux SMR transporter n=1 Tax=Iningainema tapete BLCC-T55 TaxID=2748662 RepID=A0A8J6XGX6_9CYAN|nr:multidrug efflux SMR transporter [Iningainema tapete BLCC-T55]